MSDLYLTARLKVEADKVEELKEAALAIVEPSRAEEGCISYNVHQAIDDETIFVWRECWTSKAALDEHFEMSYVKGFFEIVERVAEEQPQIVLTNLIS